MKDKLTIIGYWALIGGVILAVVLAILTSLVVTIPYLLLILFVLGLVVGFLNIKEKRSAHFTVLALLLIGVGGLQLKELAPIIISILQNLVVFMVGVGLVVALKQIFPLDKPRQQS